MKILLSSLFVCLTLTVLNAQNANTAICGTKESLIKGVQSGLIELTLPENISKSDVEKYGSYYKNSFSISFDEKSHLATIKMVENTSNNRRVILRFLSANQIQNVVVEDKSFLVNDFYENFLK
jgi:capsule polysaccharide export protein KpsE/RkpR